MEKKMEIEMETQASAIPTKHPVVIPELSRLLFSA